MDKKAFGEKLDRMRKRHIREINELCVFNMMAQSSLEMSIEEVQERKTRSFEFVVPSKMDKEISLPRTKKRILEMLNKAYERELHCYALIALVAIYESFCREVLSETFSYDPRRLLGITTDQQSTRQVSLRDVIESSSKADILERIVSDRVRDVLYQPPERIFRQMERILDVSIESDVEDPIREVKATRDLLVHNGGVVNEVYLKKAGEGGRADLGEEIPVDSGYFYQSVGVAKQFIKNVTKSLKRKHNQKVRV